MHSEDADIVSDVCCSQDNLVNYSVGNRPVGSAQGGGGAAMEGPGGGWLVDGGVAAAGWDGGGDPPVGLDGEGEGGGDVLSTGCVIHRCTHVGYVGVMLKLQAARVIYDPEEDSKRYCFQSQEE